MSESKLIAFKLNKTQLEPFKDALSIAKSPSIYFKQVIISGSPEKSVNTIIGKSKEYARYNFLLYKTSNNINQIAKVLNTLSRSNFNNEAALNKALNNLHTLETNLKSKLL